MSSNAARDAAARLRQIRDLAAADAPLAACTALGRAAETAVKVTLSSSTHSKGTVTPSEKGQPPSLISGDLRRSIRRSTPYGTGPGAYQCQVGSLLIYAPVHEYGTTIHTRVAPYLQFYYGGSWHEVTQVTIPKRPYLATATAAMIATGMFARVCETAWQSAIDL